MYQISKLSTVHGQILRHLKNVWQPYRQPHRHRSPPILWASFHEAKNNRSRTENVTEQTRFSKSRSNDLEDISQGQRSSHATDLLILVIICTKYGKNPSRTVDATERTRFSRSRPNDLKNIGHGQRPLHATHPLKLMMIYAKYGKSASRIVDFFFKVKAEKLAKNWNFRILL